MTICRGSRTMNTTTNKQQTIKEIRESMHLSQSQFAKEFGFNLRTLQEWEYGRTKTPVYVVKLLQRVLEAESKAYE